MNYSIIRYVLGTVLKFESLFLLLPVFVGVIYGERSAWSFLVVALMCLGGRTSELSQAEKLCFLRFGRFCKCILELGGLKSFRGPALLGQQGDSLFYGCCF